MSMSKNSTPDRKCSVSQHATEKLEKRIDGRVRLKDEYIEQLYHESIPIEVEDDDSRGTYPSAHRIHPSEFVTLQIKRYKEYDKITSVFLFDAEKHKRKGYKLDDVMYCKSCDKLYRHTEPYCDCPWCGADHSRTEWAGWVFKRNPPSEPGENP